MVSPDEVRAKLEAGRRAVTSGLRQLAAQLESLPLEDAAGAISWLQDGLERLRREAERILRTATRE